MVIHSINNSTCDILRLKSLGAPSKLKNGKKSDIVHKGGRGSDQNHSFELLGKNDISYRREGGLDVFVTIKSLNKCKAKRVKGYFKGHLSGQSLYSLHHMLHINRF